MLKHATVGSGMFAEMDTETLQQHYAEIGKELLRRGVLEDFDLRYSEHDYQRQAMLDGWIQRDRHVRNTKDGTREYLYWSYHWIEDGKRKSEHIGSDAKLEQWKQRHGIQS